jgi:hypothetical protein
MGKHSWKAVGFPCFSVNSASVELLVDGQLTELNDEGEGEPPLPSPLSRILSFPVSCSTFE